MLYITNSVMVGFNFRRPSAEYNVGNGMIVDGCVNWLGIERNGEADRESPLHSS